MSNGNNPPKWWQVVNTNTKEGNEEQKFFMELARNPKFDWRSVSSLSKATGLSEKRIEEIISKYFNKGMVFQNPKNDEHWGYWELHPKLVPKVIASIANKDQKNRIAKATGDPGDTAPVAPKKKAKAKAASPQP